ncbi:MAG TPA: hypothetical protein VHC98_04020 [Candidatus Saccharimonadales bacterium]|nr:hypothetical protein [Candidatus Saccharimonadales bacterium]
MFAVCSLSFALTLSLLALRPAVTSATAPTTLNFQARLETASGSIVPDGSYNVTFHLFTASSSSGSTDTGCGTDSACEWTEAYTYSSGPGSSDARIRVANGYLTVNLGSLTAFGTSVDWTSQQWLTMDIGGTAGSGTITWDGQMSPRILLTSTPYAFQAGSATQLKVTSGANSTTLSAATPTGTDSISLPDASGTVCLQNATACGFAPASGGSGYVQLQGGTPGTAQTGHFNITGTGIAGSLQAGSLDTATAGALSIGGTNATSISLGTTGSNIQTTINGTALVKPTTGHDSTTAFQVQNASGSNLLTVDSSNTAIVLGNDGTPTALTVRGGAATGTDTAGANLTFDASNGTGSGGSGDIIFRTAQAGGPTVGFDQAASGSDGSGASATFSWSQTVSNNANRLLIVYAGTEFGTSVSTVTYGGTPLTHLIDNGSDPYTTIWYMVNPPVGTATVAVTMSTNVIAAGGSASFYNVNQTTPFGTSNFTNGTSTTISGSISTTSTHQLVVDAVGAYNQPVTPAAGQTVNTNVSAGDGIQSASSRAAATGGTVTMTWTSSSFKWGHVLATINPVSSGGSTPDTLQDTLHIARSGNIGIDQANPQYTLDVNGMGNFATAVQTPLLQSAPSTALTITGNAASTWSTTAGDLTIQGGSGTVSLGTSTNLTASGDLTIHAGTATNALTLGGSIDTGTLTLGQSNQGQTIYIGHVTVATGKTQTIGIGDSATGTGKDVITIGNTNGASSLTLQAGTGNVLITGANSTTYTLGPTAGTGAITLGRSTASNTISIGAANTTTGNTQTINIGSGTGAGTGKATVTLGSLANASSTTIQGGTGNINLNVNQSTAGVIVKTVTNNSATALQVQNASGANLFTADTANTAIVLGNDGTPSALTVRGGAATGTNVAGANLTLDASNGTGTGGSGDLIFRTAAGSTPTTVTHDADGTFSSAGPNATCSITIGSNNDRIVFAMISPGDGNPAGVTAVKLDGTTNFTHLTDSAYTTVWYLLNPSSGAHTINITDSAAMTGGCSSFYNVNQSTPIAASNTANGSSTTASVTVSGTTTAQLVVDFASTNGPHSGWSAGGSQTTDWTQGGTQNASSRKTGTSSSTTMSWSWTGSDLWATIAMAINPDSGSAVSDTLTDRLHIKANGNVGIDNSNPQYALDVMGTIQGSTSVLTPILDAPASSTLSIGTTNATSITLGNATNNILTTINGRALVKPTSGHDSTSAFQVQNASGNNLFTVDSSNTAIVLGNDGTPSSLTVRGGAATGTNAVGANLTFDASNGTGTGGSGDLIFRTAAPSISTPTDDGNDSTGHASSTTSLTFSHTVANNANRILIVGVATGCGFGGTCAATVSSVTYGGVSLTTLNNTDCTTGAAHCHIEFWYLVGPATGTANVVITAGASTTIEAGASSYYNVDPTTPFGTSAVAASNNNPSTLSVPSNTTQVVVDVITSDNVIVSPSAGQTQRYNDNSTGLPVASSTQPGAASSTSMGWSDGSSHYATVGVAMNPPAGSSSDTLQDRLHITAAGNVGINTASPQYTLDVAGTANIKASSTTALQVQNASSSVLFSADTTNMQVVIGTTTNGLVLTSTGIMAYGTAQHTKAIVLTPEYANAVLDAAGDATCSAANSGTLTAGLATGLNGFGNSMQSFYKWTTTSATSQCYDIVVQVPIPSDFAGWATNPLSVNAYTTDTTNGTIKLEARDSSNNAGSGTVICNYVNVTPGSASTWATNNSACTLSSGTYTPGSYMTLRIRLSATSAVSAVEVGNITLSYKSSF